MDKMIYENVEELRIFPPPASLRNDSYLNAMMENISIPSSSLSSSCPTYYEEGCKFEVKSAPPAILQRQHEHDTNNKADFRYLHTKSKSYETFPFHNSSLSQNSSDYYYCNNKRNGLLQFQKSKGLFSSYDGVLQTTLNDDKLSESGPSRKSKPEPMINIINPGYYNKEDKQQFDTGPYVGPYHFTKGTVEDEGGNFMDTNLEQLVKNELNAMLPKLIREIMRNYVLSVQNTSAIDKIKDASTYNNGLEGGNESKETLSYHSSLATTISNYDNNNDGLEPDKHYDNLFNNSRPSLITNNVKSEMMVEDDDNFFLNSQILKVNPGKTTSKEELLSNKDNNSNNKLAYVTNVSRNKLLSPGIGNCLNGLGGSTNSSSFGATTLSTAKTAVNPCVIQPYFSVNEGIVRYKRKKNVANRNYFNYYYNAYLNRYDGDGTTAYPPVVIPPPEPTNNASNTQTYPNNCGVDNAFHTTGEILLKAEKIVGEPNSYSHCKDHDKRSPIKKNGSPYKFSSKKRNRNKKSRENVGGNDGFDDINSSFLNNGSSTYYLSQLRKRAKKWSNLMSTVPGEVKNKDIVPSVERSPATTTSNKNNSNSNTISYSIPEVKNFHKNLEHQYHQSMLTAEEKRQNIAHRNQTFTPRLFQIHGKPITPSSPFTYKDDYNIDVLNGINKINVVADFNLKQESAENPENQIHNTESTLKITTAHDDKNNFHRVNGNMEFKELETPKKLCQTSRLLNVNNDNSLNYPINNNHVSDHCQNEQGYAASIRDFLLPFWQHHYHYNHTFNPHHFPYGIPIPTPPKHHHPLFVSKNPPCCADSGGIGIDFRYFPAPSYSTTSSFNSGALRTPEAVQKSTKTAAATITMNCSTRTPAKTKCRINNNLNMNTIDVLTRQNHSHWDDTRTLEGCIEGNLGEANFETKNGHNYWEYNTSNGTATADDVVLKNNHNNNTVGMISPRRVSEKCESNSALNNDSSPIFTASPSSTRSLLCQNKRFNEEFPSNIPTKEVPINMSITEQLPCSVSLNKEYSNNKFNGFPVPFPPFPKCLRGVETTLPHYQDFLHGSSWLFQGSQEQSYGHSKRRGSSGMYCCIPRGRGRPPLHHNHYHHKRGSLSTNPSNKFQTQMDTNNASHIDNRIILNGTIIDNNNQENFVRYPPDSVLPKSKEESNLITTPLTATNRKDTGAIFETVTGTENSSNYDDDENDNVEISDELIGTMMPSNCYDFKNSIRNKSYRKIIKKEGNDYAPPSSCNTNSQHSTMTSIPPSAVRDSKAKLKEELAEIFNSNFEITRLTPIHLRKAKLMFFYTRYPNSNVLKTYFSDIKFNRNNIAQLVKWFSNFREFFYIQIEKFARQALAEGVTDCTDLDVSDNSELYRTLIVHYNRNNHIQVPSHFRSVCQKTLKEFFKAICGYRDREPSWKKCIYKIIAQLDVAVPEYFKTQNFLRQLE